MRPATAGAAGAVVALALCGLVSLQWRTRLPLGQCEAHGIVFHGFQNNVPVAGGAKGSCWCGDKDGYCLCTPSLSIDAALLVCNRGSQVPSVPVVSRRNVPLGGALPGGYVNVGETVEDAASREVFEEIGVRVNASTFEQVHLFSSPHRDFRRHGAAQFLVAVAPATTLVAGDDAKSVHLQRLDDSLDRADFAFPDHFDMLQLLMSRLQSRQTPICKSDGTLSTEWILASHAA
eukprot:m.211842 g.211842  ORF g.211842 m.211842 type:complete len:233 (+) comp25701_c0_seq1:163-861(+)